MTHPQPGAQELAVQPGDLDHVLAGVARDENALLRAYAGLPQLGWRANPARYRVAQPLDIARRDEPAGFAMRDGLHQAAGGERD